MTRATVELELEFQAPASDEELDAWSWALEKQIEEMALVKTARVVDYTEVAA